MLDIAEAEHRCAFGADDRERRALKRRAEAGVLTCPYLNVYARVEYWNTLTAIEQTKHVASTLSLIHPRWVFAGSTAACILGFDHGYSLHRDRTIVIACTYSGTARDHGRLIRIRMPAIPSVAVGDVLVTDAARTLLDCALSLTFQEALPIFDSAARSGVETDRVLDLCRSLQLDSAAVRRLCTYTDPLSDNGGESLARATIIVLGFIIPILQHHFMNPDNPEAPYRTDFMWMLPDGRIIVAEYDGMGKYVLSAGQRRASIQSTVHAERIREEHLKQQGVSVIIRFEYEDVVHPERLERKLLDAGVPKRMQSPPSPIRPVR